MSKRLLKKMLRRMPRIAKSVNAFNSLEIQKLAYKDIMDALNASLNGDGKTAAAAEPSPPKPAAEAATPSSTADILAQARAAKMAAAKPAANQPAAKKATVPAAAPESAAEPTEKSESPVEVIKRQSNYLRGNLAAELLDGTDHFSKDSTSIIKHFGFYQEVNRDTRQADREAGKHEDSHEFMLRSKIPGGKLTSAQLLAEIDLGDEFANSTLRVTSRQGLQLHGVLKSNLKATIQRINEIQLSTLGACGDVNRNVMCCPGPYQQPIYREAQQLADRLAATFAPRTRAYHELWLRNPQTGEEQLVGGGNGQEGNGQEVEPLYGTTYLPRKFKMAIAFPFDNCVDVYTNDLGLLAVVRDGRIVGYNVLVGGGQGVTPSAKKTFPALAKRMTFAKPEQVVDVATAVVKVQRDFGNRSDRKVARLKYLIHNWGLEKFKAKVEEYYGQSLPDPDPADVHGFNDHMGWDDQGDGKKFYGLNIENGRILDSDALHLKAAIREICRTFQPGVRLTAHQSILFTDLDPACKDEFESILRKHRVKLTEEISAVRRWSMACVAWPFCGLSITESERALPGIIDIMEIELAKLGLSSDEFTVRMTGCPNGCARPYNSDIGLVGKAKDKYTIFVGGRKIGDRLNFIFKDMVGIDEIVPTLVPLFAYFKQSRQAGETFGDFCHRRGQADLLAWSEQFSAASA